MCRTIASHMATRFATQIRGGLTALLLDKNLRLGVDEARKNAVVTLMSSDMDAVVGGTPRTLETPFMVLECGLGIYFLARMIQQSAFVVVIPFLFATVISYLLGKRATAAQTGWFEASQARVTAASKLLPQLQAVKVLGLGPKAAEYIQHLRILEMKKFKVVRRVQTLIIMFAVVCEELCPALVVTVALFWGAFGKVLSPQQVYPTLTMVSLVEYPIGVLFSAVASAMNTLGSLERIREFLCKEEHTDPRVLLQPQACEITRMWPAAGKADSSVLETREVVQDASRVVHFDAVSIAPAGSKTPVLKDLTLSIPPESIMGVFGSTGSGKTTFLHSILGEVEIIDGVIYVNDIPIAYVGQEPYLPNMSVRDCVIGHCPYEEGWFKTVTTACKLSEDITQLPGGEDYMVGTGGIGLSGGQRQRLSIARAVYVRASFVILDDALSALDRKTASAIITNLCGEDGLLRKSGTTVIIASHLLECLDISTDLVFLDGNGHLHHESGGASPEFRAKVQHLLRQKNDETAEQEEEKHQDGTASPSRGAKPSGVQRAEQTVNHKGDKSLYWFWIKAAGVGTVCFWLVVIFTAALFDIFSLAYLRLWIAHAPSNKYFLIGYDAFPFLIAISTGLGYLLLNNGFSAHAAIELHFDMTITIVGTTLGYLSVIDSGSLLNRLSLDMEILTKHVPPNLHNAAYQLLGFLGKLGMAAAGSVYMLIFLPVVLIVILLIQRLYLRTSRQLRHLQIEAQAPIVTTVSEASQGLIYIRGFGWEKQNLDESLRVLGVSQQPTFMLASGQQLLQLAIFSLMALLTLVLSILALYVGHGRTANSIGAAFLSIVILGERLSAFIVGWTGLEIAIGALARVRSFLADTPRECGGTSSLPENWPSKGEVKVESLTAWYRADETVQAPVLRDVSLAIEAGKRVNVYGQSGSGKSSFLYALLGFLDYDGKILIDGVELSNVPLDEVRARIVTISQDQVELDGSIRDNLFPFDREWGTQATIVTMGEKEKEKRAAQDLIIEETLVRLQIWEKVKAKGGVGALLKDVGYSFGEKQLMCIARAVVRRRVTNSKVLLVDEATGSVDQQFDQIVREMMKEYFEGCTIIVVAHREESIADGDMKVEMKNGTMGKPELL